MSDLAMDLAQRLASPRGAGLDPALWLPLLKLLSEGKPVGVDDLAAETGRPEEQLRQALAAVPDTEYDEDGRIVGLGLTLRPTRHHFTVDGRQLYTWCALDTLIFPALLDKTVTIESLSPTTGTPVRMHAGPDGVTRVEPATAVVSLVNPEDMTSVRGAFCSQVHFFASREDAQPWLDTHPGGEVMVVEEAYRVGTALAASMVEHQSSVPGETSPRCC
jgi:alkylmercury lyase